MRKEKYYYNPKTCNYEKIKRSSWDVFFDLMGMLVMTLLLSTGAVGLYTTYFDTAKEVALKKQNGLLKRHYERLQEKIQESNTVLAALRERDNQLYRTFLEVDPVPLSTGVGGVDIYQDLADQSVVVAETAQAVDSLNRQLEAQQKSYSKIEKLARSKARLLSCMPAIAPVRPEQLRRQTRGFGLKYHPILKRNRLHKGLDFPLRRGDQILATGDGKVVRLGYDPGGWGKFLVINHQCGYKTLYAHVSKFCIKKGTYVKRGQVIAKAGNTGLSTSTHLHYEVHKRQSNGKYEAVNPVGYIYQNITPKEYKELLRKVSMATQTLD